MGAMLARYAVRTAVLDGPIEAIHRVPMIIAFTVYLMQEAKLQPLLKNTSVSECLQPQV